MDPTTALIAGLAGLGVNITAIIAAYVRINVRLATLEAQVAILLQRSSDLIPPVKRG